MQRVALGQISLDAAPERARPAIVLSNLSVSGKFENEGLLLLKASMHPEEETPQLAHGETVRLAERCAGTRRVRAACYRTAV